MTVNLISPIAIEEGLRFAIREGDRTIGAGVISEILDNNQPPEDMLDLQEDILYLQEDILDLQEIIKKKMVPLVII